MDCVDDEWIGRSACGYVGMAMCVKRIYMSSRSCLGCLSRFAIRTFL